MNRSQSQRGIALITTLIMLSVVTLMAVAFLAVSRRERAAVTTSTDRADAKSMAEAALQRAEAEVVSRVLAVSNLLSYDLLVSTNFINGAGFNPNSTDIGNVSYFYPNGTPVTGDDLLALYRNLQVDARAPVFIETNAATGEEDFRYFLDFNRNGLYETNGMQVEVDGNGRSLGFTNFHIGDPEWIGVLRRPDHAHSGSNQFVGRFAYLILPAGKTLDLNFLHNQAKRVGPAADGFHRNQGVGSWEINLAAFLRELNTNAWPTYLYRTNLFTSSSGVSFENAVSLLRYRFRRNAYDVNPSFNRLQSVRQIFRAEGANAFERDGIDGYSDGVLQLGVERPYRINGLTFEIQENDEPNDPWPGAENPFQYFDPQELFSVSEPSISQGTAPIDRFTNRLYQASVRRSTYDRHTFYRLLGQLGTDSVPASRGRIDLNYDNRLDFDPRLAGARPNANWGFSATNFVGWAPAAFFTNAADAILKTYYPPGTPGLPTIAVTNIPIWPTNFYTPATHRALQLAANIFDATTNASQTVYPYLPHAYRPVFGRSGNSVTIASYEPVWDGRAFWLNSVTAPGQHIDVDDVGLTGTLNRNTHVAGVPLVIGAKKGFPNFNEFALQTVVQATRKLELVKPSPLARPNLTNQLYTLGISNLFGVEFWNSYTQAFTRTLELRVRLETDMVLSNDVRVIRRVGPLTLVTNILFDRSSPQRTWQGQEFKLPVSTVFSFLPDSIYRSDGTFLSLSNRTQFPFEPARGFPTPTWRLAITNRIQAMLIDVSPQGAGRIVDYVDLDNLNSIIDVTSAMFGEENAAGQTSLVGSFWQTNRVGGIPEGVRNQIQASLGSINVAEWNSAAAEPIQGQDKEKAVEGFRQFIGLSGTPAPPSPTLRMQVPFSPARKLFQNKTWQVNDPLVNDLYSDLEDPARTNDIRYVKPVRAPIGSETHNLGQINYRYRPWQRSPYSSSDPTDFDLGVKDPQITRSDNWDFPTNDFPSLGWLGRVHRGTPWQSVYLKSVVTPIRDWFQWSGDPPRILRGQFSLILPSTHPTNDWILPDLFTTSIGDNASRGLLSVNQDGQAAWSAVLSGVPVLTNLFATNTGPFLIEPATPEVRQIVQGINLARVFRQGGRFNYLGEVLSTPELTVASPYLRLTAGPNGTPSDAVVERIPQMVLSLLKRDEPRFVVYAYGQSLRPAQGSVVTEFGPYFQMPTNYTITGEYVTKTLMRLETVRDVDPQTGRPRIRILPVKESYNEVPPTE